METSQSVQSCVLSSSGRTGLISPHTDNMHIPAHNLSHISYHTTHQIFSQPRSQILVSISCYISPDNIAPLSAGMCVDANVGGDVVGTVMMMFMMMVVLMMLLMVKVVVMMLLMVEMFPFLVGHESPGFSLY